MLLLFGRKKIQIAMANFNLNFNNNSINKALKNIEKLTVEKMKKILKDEEVYNEVKELYNKAVKNNSDPFRLDKQDNSDELIGEFGVGEAGEPAEDKIKFAWKELQIDGEATKFTGKTRRTRDTIGGFTISIDKNKFYLSEPATVVNDSKTGGGNIIPWMQWYIEGESTPKYYLLFDDEQGRTGIAVMAKIHKKTKKFYTPWKSPSREYIWDDFATGVTEELDKKVNSLVRKILRKLKKKK